MVLTAVSDTRQQFAAQPKLRQLPMRIGPRRNGIRLGAMSAFTLCLNGSWSMGRASFRLVTTWIRDGLRLRRPKRAAFLRKSDWTG